jgi:hypothetical protein
MATPTQEYYKAKAELCETLAIRQILEGDGENGVKNLLRMVNALNQVEGFKSE